MKKLLTKLAGSAMLATCLSVPLNMDAKTVYFDRGNDSAVVCAYAYGGLSGNPAWNVRIESKHVGGSIYAMDVKDYTNVIFTKGTGDDKFTDECTVKNGHIYSSSNQAGSPYELYINGDGINNVGGWTTDASQLLKFTPSENAYEWNVVVTTKSNDKNNFRFVDKTRNTQYCPENGSYTQASESGNQFKDGESNSWWLEKDKQYTITVNLADKKFSVSANGGQIGADTYTYSLWNNFGNSDQWNRLDFTEVNGVLTASYVFDSPTESIRGFGVKTFKNGSDTGSWHAAPSNAYTANLGVTTTFSLTDETGRHNIEIPAGAISCKFELTVSNNVPQTLKVTVQKREVAYGNIPDNLWIQAWQNNGAKGPNEMTWNEETKIFTGIIPCVSHDDSGWVYMRLGVKSDNGSWTSTWGATSQNANLYFDENDRTKELKEYSGDSDFGNFKCNFKGYNSWQGDVMVIADFSSSTPKITVVPAYYFVGDLNKWFSKEFDGGDKLGMDVEERDANKANWIFEPVFDENGQFTKWYTINIPLLAGQFQIFDGNWWDTGNTFSHTKSVDANTDDAFKTYFADTLKLGGADNSVRRKTGSNLHLPCNAVENATISFNADELKVRIDGDERDYFIFYDRSGDRNRDANSDPLRAHINSEKPNKNNYFIPFNKVYHIKDGKEGDLRVACTNVNGDTDHMNYTENQQWNSNGKKMAHGNLASMSESEREQIFGNAPDVLAALEKGELPNGVNVKDRDIWYAKVPNGFAAPAGTKFTVAFRNSKDEKSYQNNDPNRPYWTALGTYHLYFFDGIHVHVNNESWENLWDTEISYRVYAYGIDYETKVADPATGVLSYKKADRGAQPAATTESDNDGWVVLSNDHKECSKWWHSVGTSDCGCQQGKHNWRVNDIEPENVESINRMEIPAGLSSSRIQLRIKISPKTTRAKAAGQSFDPYTVYIPSAPTIAQSDDEIKLKGVDHYIVLDNKDGVWTGIEDILDDLGFEGEDGVDAADAAPIYYNLQGVRVENPGKGLYIVVRGNKSEKVLF